MPVIYYKHSRTADPAYDWSSISVIFSITNIMVVQVSLHQKTISFHFCSNVDNHNVSTLAINKIPIPLYPYVYRTITIYFAVGLQFLLTQSHSQFQMDQQPVIAVNIKQFWVAPQPETTPTIPVCWRQVTSGWLDALIKTACF